MLKDHVAGEPPVTALLTVQYSNPMTFRNMWWEQDITQTTIYTWAVLVFAVRYNLQGRGQRKPMKVHANPDLSCCEVTGIPAAPLYSWFQLVK